MKKEQIDAIEADVMDWFYNTCEVLFDAEGMVMDATELRAILDEHLSPSHLT